MNHPASTTKTLLLAGFALAFAAVPVSLAFGQNAGLDAMLNRFDSNSNGQLELTEVPSQYRLLIDRAAKQAGMDTTKPISIERLKQAAAGQNEEDRGDDRGDDRGRDRGRDRGDWGRDRGDRDRDRDRRDGDRSSQAASLVPGFGADPEDPDAVLVPGFGAPDGSEKSIPLEDRYDERVLRYVDREILGNHDRNRNGMIDGDEWRRVPWGDDPRQDDKNRDGRLSREDLAGRMARRWGFGEKRQEGSRDDRDDRDRDRDRGDRGRDDRRRDEGDRDRGGNDEERKYRSYAEGVIRSYDKNRDKFLTHDEWQESKIDIRSADRNRDNRVDAEELATHLMQVNRRRAESSRSSNGGGEQGGGSTRFDTAHERLPKGTPSWFVEKDANADGQVAMAEYSTTWNDSTVQEFAKYDGNDDGIITPVEAINPRPDATKASASASASSSSARSGSEGDARSDRGDRRDSPSRRRGSFRGG